MRPFTILTKLSRVIRLEASLACPYSDIPPERFSAFPASEAGEISPTADIHMHARGLLRRRIKFPKGLTLLEMVMALSILAVLLVAFTFAYFISLKNHSYQIQRFDSRQTAIWALENIGQDLRQATNITAADTNTTTFTISPYETIQYNLTSAVNTTQLIRTYTLSTTPATTKTSAVAKNISDLTIEYYDSSGTLLTAPVTGAQLANIRLVKTTLLIQSALWSNNETWTLRSEVRPRNL